MTEDGEGNARVHERVNACYGSASGRPAGDEEVNAEGIAATRGVDDVADDNQLNGFP